MGVETIFKNSRNLKPKIKCKPFFPKVSFEILYLHLLLFSLTCNHATADIVKETDWKHATDYDSYLPDSFFHLSSAARPEPHLTTTLKLGLKNYTKGKNSFYDF